MHKFKDVKVFVPAKDFNSSMKFYQKLGWKMKWEHSHSMAELELANQSFLLQNFYVKKWAENFMMYIRVDDVQSFYEFAIEIIKEFPAARINAPKKEQHANVCYIWDPSGVLLHFAEEP